MTAEEDHETWSKAPEQLLKDRVGETETDKYFVKTSEVF